MLEGLAIVLQLESINKEKQTVNKSEDSDQQKLTAVKTYKNKLN